MSSEMKCPFHASAGTAAHSGSRGNRDWWPNQLNVGILNQPAARANPMGESFDYAAEFKTLDLDAVVADLKALMT
ncbi:MAG: catalase-peroxidase, partial [Ideonella sp.]|nr:catalase-peroxidase [Ideonella sp.]